MTTTAPLNMTLPDHIPAHDPIVAHVPAQLLWAAAQFASTDSCKELLTNVCIRHSIIREGEHQGPAITIASTDGHRLFRAIVPCSEWFTINSETFDNELGFKVAAKPLKKAVAYAQYARLRKSGSVTFVGGKKRKGSEAVPSEFLSSLNASVHPWDSARYPNVDQLFPDHFGQGTEPDIAFNARYLAEWCKVVEKLSTSGVVRMKRNHPITPAVFECDFELFSVGVIKLECLIMPVQLRG